MLDEIFGDGKNSISLFIKIYNVLNGAMKQAVNMGILLKNPCNNIAFPDDNSKKMRCLNIEEQRDFIKALEGEVYQALYMTYVFTGARLGELPALTWKDIDYEKRYIDINKKAVIVHNFNGEEGKKAVMEVQNYCKTKSGSRKIYITPMLVEVLKEHEEKQKKLFNELGLKWSEDCLVFPTSNNTVLYPRNIQTIFQRICKKAGIEDASMHTLRHSYASRCFENDLDIKIISAQLGHKNVRTTYDIYVHIIPQKQLKEIDKLAVLDGLIA